MPRLIAQLTSRLQALNAEAETLAAVLTEREPTAEESARIDQIQAARRRLTDQIAAETAIQEATPTAPADPPVASGITHIRDRELDRPWGERYVAASAPPAVRLACEFADFLGAVKAAAYGSVDVRLLAAAQGAGITDPASGGYLVPVGVGNDLRLRIMTGQILSRVFPIPSGTGKFEWSIPDESSRATGSRFGGVQGYWVDEGTAATATRPLLHKIRWESRRVAALGYSTDELEQDAPAYGALMQRAFVEELRWLAENAIFRGTGAGQPSGFLGHAAAIDVSKETGQAAATIVKENLDKMWARLHGASWGNAVWLINQDTLPQLESLSQVVGTGGIPVYLPPGGIADTPNARLKGRPVIPVEYASTLGTTGDIALVDLSQYGFMDHGGVAQATSIHVAFVTHEQAFRATWRVDGKPLWRTVLTPANGSNTQAPFITLATRA